MEKDNLSIVRVGIVAGLITVIAHILLFLIMRALNLLQYTELRSLNFIIQLIGIILPFRYVARRMPRKLNYLEGFGMACLVSTISVTSFAIFIFAYFYLIEPGVLKDLVQNAPMLGAHISPFTAAASVIVEGTISGLLIAFCYVQYYHNKFQP